MRIGVSSYSFSQYIQAGKLKHIDTIQAAKDIGFDCIEFTGLTEKIAADPHKYAAALRETAAKVGIPINCYTVAADLEQPTPAALDAEIERVKGEIDIAGLLGVTLMRHDAIRKLKQARSFDLALPKVADSIRRLADYAAEKGIRTMVENHGLICQDSERVERLFNAVHHENFGLLIDMGNFACVDEDSALAVSRLAGYAFHAHAKDFTKIPFAQRGPADTGIETRASNLLRGTVIGRGFVPVKQCMAILKSAGYTGDLSIEFEGSEDCMEGLREGLERLRSYAKALQIES